MRTRIVISALLLTISLFAVTEAQSLDRSKLDLFVTRLAEKNKAMGSLTIAKDGTVIYTQATGYGKINGTEKIPVTSETRYRIGSISKVFTATIIFELIDEGKLKLTDTLDKFFPQVPNASGITLAHLLTHRSGIHNFTSDTEFAAWSQTPRSQSDIVAAIAKGAPDFEPGAQYAYSNAGFILLGYIVEKVTGKPYKMVLKDRITSKIGLKDTYLGLGKTDIRKNEIFSYRYDGDWKQVAETDLSIPGGAGGIISTSLDLVKFVQALFDLKLTSKISLDRMVKDNMAITPIPVGDKTFFGHGGSIDGFDAALLYLPEEKLAMAYTANGLAYARNNILNAFFDIYRHKPFTIPTFDPVIIRVEVLDKYVGTYSSPSLPVKMTITREGTALFAQPTGQSRLGLEASAENKFTVERLGFVMEFDVAKNQMTLTGGGRVTVFDKEN